MSSPDIPKDYTMALSGSLDMDLDEIRIKELAKITTDSTVDMGLDNIRIKELPKINMCLELAMKPTRIHFPVNYRFCVNSLGMELLAFNVCGESMVVIEDYVPHKTEICR